MILHAGMTMTEGGAILNYFADQQLLIFRHWQLKSIPDAIKNICFPLLLSLSQGLLSQWLWHDKCAETESHATCELTA